MTLEDELVFYIKAKQTAALSGKLDGFKDRLNLLFVEGQLSEKAYKILKEIFGYEEVKPKKVVNNVTDGCSGSRMTYRPRC